MTIVEELSRRLTLSGSELDVTVTFNTPNLAYAAAGGVQGATVWVDANKNGKQDRNEPFKKTSGDGLAVFMGVSGSYQIGVQPLKYPFIDGKPVLRGGDTRGFSLTSLVVVLLKDVPQYNVTSGTVFFDKDRSGDEEDRLGDSDVGMAGVRAYLDENDNRQFDQGELSSTTIDDGEFVIRGYHYSEVGHSIRFVLTSGQSFTTASSIAVTADDHYTRIGIFKQEKTSTINVNVESYDPPSERHGKREYDAIDGVRVYIDLNRNGKRDHGEQSVLSDSAAEQPLRVTPGKYQLRVSQPVGYHANLAFAEIQVADRQIQSYSFHLTPVQSLNIEYYVDSNHDHRHQGREHFIQWNFADLSLSSLYFNYDVRGIAENSQHVISIDNLPPVAMKVYYEDGDGVHSNGEINRVDLPRTWKSGSTLEFPLGDWSPFPTPFRAAPAS